MLTTSDTRPRLCIKPGLIETAKVTTNLTVCLLLGLISSSVIMTLWLINESSSQLEETWNSFKSTLLLAGAYTSEVYAWNPTLTIVMLALLPVLFAFTCVLTQQKLIYTSGTSGRN